MGRWGDGEMERWRDGEMGRWGVRSVFPIPSCRFPIPLLGGVRGGFRFPIPDSRFPIPLLGAGLIHCDERKLG
ncbi:hypothetical protein [Moorena sp. SIO4G3]|uniref:hypothetical protein n=1 Tax=Moorena sp. SIO4G3 TaxID=2607821 RepID=UPI00142C32BF|nr:hypothetical protein [Moorena sp. SIO4G3]NEO80797.1 hypothetical protein [Moorena sp. SIO4G3]